MAYKIKILFFLLISCHQIYSNSNQNNCVFKGSSFQTPATYELMYESNNSLSLDSYIDDLEEKCFPDNYNNNGIPDYYYIFSVPINSSVVSITTYADSGTGNNLYLLDKEQNLIRSQYSTDEENMLTIELNKGTYVVVQETKQSMYGIASNITLDVSNTTGSELNRTKSKSSIVKYIMLTESSQYMEEYVDSEFKNIEVQYFDGLGRLEQSIQKEVTPSKKDLISFVSYDGFGRQSRMWLSGHGIGEGAYTDSIILQSSSRSLNSNNPSPFSYSVYENSPLNRIVKQFGPGEDWHENGKAIETKYLTNNSSYPCIYLKIDHFNNGTISLSKSNSYPNNQLFVTEIKDEDGNLSYEFKDKLEQVILTRKVNNGQNVDTYYVYDDFGSLCYVLPPILSDKIIKEGKSTLDESVEMKQYAYLYKYDKYKRCVAKRLPGCEWIYYVYDKADQLILSQDGEQRKENKWSFMKYDALGRVIISGIQPINNTHENLRSKYENTVVLEYPKEDAYGYSWDTMQGDAGAENVLTINHYDDYDHLLFQGFYDILKYYNKEGYGKCYIGELGQKSAKGLLTGTRDKLLDGSGDEIVTAMYYDERGRVIQTRKVYRKSNWAFDKQEDEYIAYNFTGQPLKKFNYLQMSGQSDVSEIYTYDYDHAGRLIRTTHQLDNNTPVILDENTYDELGRLKSTIANNNQLLKTEYTYNIRSWISTIESDIFTERLFYNELVSNNEYGSSYTEVYNKPSYNGNISKMYSGASNYNLYYDNLSQLTSASYMRSRLGTKREITYSTEYEYDNHGNLTNLIRYGQKNSSPQFSDMIDDLQIHHKGNQISRIYENAENPLISTSYDFKDYTNGANVQYVYNSNGAIINDPYKGMTVSYHCNNMPKKVRVTNDITNGDIEYTYSAAGQKLQTAYYNDKKLSINPNPTIPGTVIQPKNGIIVVPARTFVERNDYIGNKIYKTVPLKLSKTITSLDKILTNNGYIKDGIYFFYIKDHLGNNCIVLNQNGEVIQQNDYYPFGMPYTSNREDAEIQKLKFGGKEFDTMHGLNMYDFHARQYNSTVPSFMSIDPLCEKYYWISPYVYCANNPLKYADPDGKKYIDKTKAKIYTVNGVVQMKYENLSYFTRGRINYINKTPRLWQGGLGFNGTITTLDRERPGMVGPDTRVGVTDVEKPRTKSGDIDGRYTKDRSMASMSPNAKGGAVGLLALNVTNEVFDTIDKMAVYMDQKDIKQQLNLLLYAMGDVNEALKLGLIPEEYQTDSNLSAILNYVFQEENRTEDKNIEEIGFKIIHQISWNRYKKR